jgi:hypothetical protein
MVLNVRNGLVGLIASVVMGTGILLGNYARADMDGEQFWRIIGTQQRPHSPAQGLAGAYQGMAAGEKASEAEKREEQRKQDIINAIKSNEQARAQAQENYRASQETVNYQPVQPARPQQPKPVIKTQTLEEEFANKRIFTCNRWIDLDGDKQPIDNEYQGVKTSFEEGEEMHIVVRQHVSDGGALKEVIYAPNGRKIREWSLKPTDRDVVYGSNPENWENCFKPLLNEGGVGSYKVAVYINEKLWTTHDFEIKRRPQN